MTLNGKIALVTGAGRGIGQAIALALARKGADIAVNSAHLSSAERTAELIRQIGSRVIAIKADVANPRQVETMVNRVITNFGGIHILINNAGVNLEFAPTVEQSTDKWDRTINVNLRGTYLCCREAGRWMVAHGSGKIVNIASIAGMTGVSMRTAYSPSKAAIMNLTKVLAVEWGKYNINVNCIAPGYVLTDLVKEIIKQCQLDLKTLQRRTPLGRLTTVEDVASATLFLVSDEAKNITGVTLPVDGGWSVHGWYM